MTPCALEADAALADRRRVRRNVVPQGEAHVTANTREQYGFWAVVRHGRAVEHFNADDRDAAIELARRRVAELGLRFVMHEPKPSRRKP